MDLLHRFGCVCGKATEQYPEMELKDVGFDASTIAYAKAVLTNRHGDYNGPTVCYLAYATAPDKSDYSIQHKSASAWCSDTELKEYRFELDTMLSWSDTLHGLKFIPTYSGSFTVKSITLYASLPHTTLYGKNGRELRFGDYLPKIGANITR